MISGLVFSLQPERIKHDDINMIKVKHKRFMTYLPLLKNVKPIYMMY